LSTIRQAIVVQAALESRAACTTMAKHILLKPLDQIKIRLKHCDQQGGRNKFILSEAKNFVALL